VIVTTLPASAAVLLAVKVSVDPVCAAAGENDAVTPAGSPLADRLTLPVKPDTGVM
jgi:hypothetical protein